MPLEPVAAQIVGAALEQRDARRAAERRGHQRQVLGEELILQRAGAGGDQHAQARQQRRHQVGEGLAGAGAGLDHQRFARAQGVGDALRPCAAASRRTLKSGSARASGPPWPNMSSRSSMSAADCGLCNTWCNGRAPGSLILLIFMQITANAGGPDQSQSERGYFIRALGRPGYT